MKTIHLILGVLAIFLITTIMLGSIQSPELITGQAHPQFKTMLKGGSSVHDSMPSHVLAYIFGFCCTILLCLFMAVGAKRNGSLDGIRPWLIAGTIFYIVIYSLTFLSDLSYVLEGHNKYFLGWPLPTAWMMYAMWFSPVVFVILYIYKFREWVLTEDDEARFQEILKARRARRED